MAKDAEPRGLGRWLWFLLSILVGLPLLMVCGLALIGPPTPETAIFSLGVLVTVVGGLVAPWRASAAWAARAGLLIVLGVVGYRLSSAGSSATLRTYTGPAMSAGRWLDRVVPERDVAIGGSRLLIATGELDEPGLIEALQDGYARMRRAEGPVPSSVLGTFVLGQTPEDHTVHRASPGGRFDARDGVLIFLHGYMGNVTLQCWQVAQAALPVGVEVVCPSTDWRGAWEEPAGRAIVEAHIARLRAAGVHRVYLAGLSAGAIGASRIAHELSIDGLVLISGASWQASPTRVPTLIVQGARDTMTPPEPARRYAERLGRRARYVELEDASHWLLLTHHEALTSELRAWLTDREGGLRGGAP
ncbi:MAG: alpha/beta hydrolase [Sandaracinaceae bacterium]|nr:alpha/beta hydrolase [Sandaracinaceae bacterium]